MADLRWRIALLRYFNPAGAHESGLIGEDPNGTPNNLFPYVTQVAVGRLPELMVFGGDYPTPDGSGIRDYLHVMDSGGGACRRGGKDRSITGSGCHQFGTGRGHSVLELIRAFAAESGQNIPYRIAERRAGDVAASYADPTKAASLLGGGLSGICGKCARTAGAGSAKIPRVFCPART